MPFNGGFGSTPSSARSFIPKPSRQEPQLSTTTNSSTDNSYIPWSSTGLNISPRSVEHQVEPRSSSWWPSTSEGYFNLFSQETEEHDSCCGPLSLTERIYGFIICFVAGFLVSAMSFGSFSQVFLGNPTKFAVAYTIGNILSLSATMFLIGPVRQLQSMKESHRLCASLLYLTSLVMTLVSVYVFKIGIIIVFFIVLQWIGLIWYSLSYIPYGRSIATRMLASVIV